MVRPLWILTIAPLLWGQAQIILSESFEGSTFPPSEWSQSGETPDVAWERSSSQAYSGSYSARIKVSLNNNTPQQIALLTPSLDLTTTPSTDSLLFFYRFSYSSGNMGADDTLRVQGSSDGVSWTELYKIGNTGETNAWTRVVLSLSAYEAATSFQVRFLFDDRPGGPGGGRYFYLDSVMVYSGELNTPPVITELFRRPYTPAPSENVWVSAQITDNVTVARDSLYYSVDGGPYTAVGSDSVVGSRYYFTIPAQSEGSEVRYFVIARDNQDLRTASADTPAYTVATVSDVKINEILYNPIQGGSGNEKYYEWVELYNSSASVVYLSGWSFTDQDGSTFTLPDSISIAPSSYLLLVYDADSFNATWPSHGGAPVVAYGGSAPGLILGNSGDDLVLQDTAGNAVDVVWYGDGGDFSAWGHAAPSVPEGNSLQRHPDGWDTDDPGQDFGTAAVVSPGSTNPTWVEEGVAPPGVAPPALWVEYARGEVRLILSGVGEESSLELYDLRGRRRVVLPARRGVVALPHSVLPTGLYLVRLPGHRPQKVLILR